MQSCTPSSNSGASNWNITVGNREPSLSEVGLYRESNMKKKKK